jgi:hypothetical protein
MILQRFRVQLNTTTFIEDTKKSNAVIVFMNFMIFAYKQIPGFKFFFL